MPLLFSKLAPTARPDRVFAAHYEFLLRWALHFSGNDRSAAEDLVQETFVRFVANQVDVEDPINAEPLLYSYLKNVHLQEVDRARRQSFQSLTSIDFDSLNVSLREQGFVNQIEIQDELRGIVTYLCQRKQHAKSASVLLLRFFHGYFPEEIMQICNLSRPSVDCRLSDAREEVRLHLHDATRLRVIDAKQPYPISSKLVAVPTERFMEELSEILFDARHLDCITEELLVSYYSGDKRRALPHELLAHIVSCRQCLNQIVRKLEFPPASTRPPEDIAGFSKRLSSGSGGKKLSRPADVKRSILAAEKRLREMQEHRPRTLMIVVDGKVLASQDVRSTVNTQRVESSSPTFIEVVSEQRFCLLAVPRVVIPPEGPPKMRYEVPLSDGRTVSLCLSFGSSGCVIEVTYRDPAFVDWSNEAVRRRYLAELEDEDSESFAIMPAPRLGGRESSISGNVVSLLRRVVLPAVDRTMAIGGILAFLCVVSIVLWEQSKPVAVTANALLVHAESWDASSQKNGLPGVIRQSVRVHTPSQTLDRVIYRDRMGIRHPKRNAESGDTEQLKVRLKEAGIDWEEPLSAGSYQVWHDSQHVRVDHIARNGKRLLRLTTAIPNGAVSQESITIRESDFHPVGRAVEFRDNGSIEIAELDYEILPWSKVNPNVFEPLVEPTSDGVSHSPLEPRSVTPRVRVAVPPTEGEIDLAELQTRVMLNRLAAGGEERIEVLRLPTGVMVKGIVASQQRKNDLESQLHQIPHVATSVYTLEEMQALTPAVSTITSVAASTEIEVETPLQRYLDTRHWDKSDISDISQELFSHSLQIEKESRDLADLSKRFASDDHLTATGRSALKILLGQHMDVLRQEERQEQQLLRRIGIPENSPTSSEGANFQIADMVTLAEQHRRLCKQLLVNDPAESTKTEAVLIELARLAKSLQTDTETGLIPLLAEQGLLAHTSTSTEK